MSFYVRARTTYELSQYSDFNGADVFQHEIQYTTTAQDDFKKNLIVAVTPTTTTYALAQYTTIQELFIFNTHATDVLTVTFYSFAGMPLAQKQLIIATQGIRLTDINTAFPLVMSAGAVPITVQLVIIGT